MTYKKPLPKPNADTQPFWEGCRTHRLRFQKCDSCGHVRWPASVICPICHSEETVWITSGGRGKIHTYAVYHVAFDPAFEDDLPYITAIVELSEGPRMLTNIVGCDPSDLMCDMPVEVTWDDVTGDFSLPKFRPSRRILTGSH